MTEIKKPIEIQIISPEKSYSRVTTIVAYEYDDTDKKRVGYLQYAVRPNDMSHEHADVPIGVTHYMTWLMKLGEKNERNFYIGDIGSFEIEKPDTDNQLLKRLFKTAIMHMKTRRVPCTIDKVQWIADSKEQENFFATNFGAISLMQLYPNENSLGSDSFSLRKSSFMQINL